MPADLGSYAPAHLAALVAVVEHGTFDAAARALHVTPSAISQRIRALEAQVGQVVVSRSTPCAATDAGEVLVTLGRQTALLALEAAERLGGASGVRRAAVAVNADSLATWFRDVFAEAATWDEVALELFVEDQAHSARLLREGRVLAAVTSDARPVQGCSVAPIGSLNYHPVVASAVLERAGGDAQTADWSGVPMVRFNEIDELQHEWLHATGRPDPRVVHRVPTTVDFAEAVRHGLGWGMYLDGQLAAARERGDDLVELSPGRPLVVPLFWQRWRISSALLDRLTSAVLAAAPGSGRPQM